MIPAGLSFDDMVALKGKAEIGDQINKAIIAPSVAANQQLSPSDFPDFNDQAKLGGGKGQFLTPAEMSRVITQLAQNPKVRLD